MKVNSILKELDEMRKINENLNNENLNLRTEKSSNLDNSSEENKKGLNIGVNLHTFLDEQCAKQNSNILNMREIFKKCNTLKKKFSQKAITIHSILNLKSLKTFTRDHSTGSSNSHISARIVDEKIKKFGSELNGVSRSHIPIQPRKNSNSKRSKFYYFLSLFI